jgi:hypothetical protein
MLVQKDMSLYKAEERLKVGVWWRLFIVTLYILVLACCVV